MEVPRTASIWTLTPSNSCLMSWNLSMIRLETSMSMSPTNKGLNILFIWARTLCKTRYNNVLRAFT